MTATAVALLGTVVPQAASAGTYALIQGSGSSSAANLVNEWVADADARGLRVVYTANGSTQGRKDFAHATTDFAVTDLPYQGGADVSSRPYAEVPLVGSGLALVYNLQVGGNRVHNLRLSGETLARIFTGRITSWADPAIAADNNGRILPATPITPVVRADASGTTEVLTDYFATQFPSIWGPCNGGDASSAIYFPLHCGATSGPDVAMSGADGMLNRIKSSGADGSIGYVDNSYGMALYAPVPVASVENAAGFFVPPTSGNVAVALAGGPGAASDPRAYPLSHYEHAIVPTSPTDPRMSTAKRQSLVDFLSYAVCAGQGVAGPYGGAPLPRNLVTEALTQISQVAAGDTAVDLAQLDPSRCSTPSLDEIAPPPQDCQAAGAGPCGTLGPPTNTLAPAVVGAVRVGATVQATTGWWDGVDTLAYRWLVDGRPITGATRETYRVPAALLGHAVSVQVTGASADFPARTVRSAAKRVERGRLTGTRLTVAGRPVLGRTLAVRGTAVRGATIRVQWYAAGRTIPGAHGLRWKLRRAQVGKRVTVRVTASAPAYETLTRTAPRTRVVRRH